MTFPALLSSCSSAGMEMYNGSDRLVTETYMVRACLF